MADPLPVTEANGADSNSLTIPNQDNESTCIHCEREWIRVAEDGTRYCEQHWPRDSKRRTEKQANGHYSTKGKKTDVDNLDDVPCPF